MELSQEFLDKLAEKDKKLKEDIEKGKVKVCSLDNKDCENCGA